MLFLGCSELEEINISSSVETIGKDVFSRCKKLKNINVDENNKNFASVDGVLYNKELTKIISYPQDKIFTNIPNTITTIGHLAYCGCLSIKELNIPNNILYIENRAFQYCPNLENITIPKSVLSIGDGVFFECKNLNNIIIDKDNPNYCIEDKIIYNKNKTKLIFCQTDKDSVNIPSSVQSIENFAFVDCSKLKEINLPENITNIGSSAFACCKNLETITIPKSVDNLGRYTFSYCENLKEIYILSNNIDYKDNKRNLFENCVSLQKVYIPEDSINFPKVPLSCEMIKQ